jgi:uncharacterized membrane protein
VAREGQLAARGSKLEFLNSTGALSGAVLLAAGELILDKLPKTPARTKPGPLAARAVSGALCGAVLCSARKRSPWLGGLYGALGAVGATYAAYHLRHAVKETLHVPDAVVAVAEDAIVAGGGLLIASRLTEQLA